MNYNTKELPVVSEEIQERMQNLDWKDNDNDECICCKRPLNTKNKFVVHMATTWEMIHNDDPRLNDQEWINQNSQGCFPVGNTCAKKIGKNYKHK
tara:strand:- start:440 stop:724 length:285 start_codon:yes stop_codon:yes gene_type:complete